MKEKMRRSIDSHSCLFSKVIKFNSSYVWTLHLCMTIFKPFKNTSDPRRLPSLRASSNAKAVAYILPTAQARPNNKARTDVEALPCIFFSLNNRSPLILSYKQVAPMCSHRWGLNNYTSKQPFNVHFHCVKFSTPIQFQPELFSEFCTYKPCNPHTSRKHITPSGTWIYPCTRLALSSTPLLITTGFCLDMAEVLYWNVKGLGFVWREN